MDWFKSILGISTASGTTTTTLDYGSLTSSALNQLGGTVGGTAAANQYIDSAILQQMAHSQAPEPRDFRKVTSKSDLDHAVFKTPIEALVNLWLAKFGDDWVEKDRVIGDDFFEWAAMRLRALGRLEEHTIWDPPLPHAQPYQQQLPLPGQWNNVTTTSHTHTLNTLTAPTGQQATSSRKVVIRIVDK